MTDINIQDLNSDNVPFFSRYLESLIEQVSEAEIEGIQGGVGTSINSANFGSGPIPTNPVGDRFRVRPRYPS